MRLLTARLEDGYCIITVVNHRLITVIRFVSKSYTHPWKGFTDKFRSVLHACICLFLKIFSWCKPNTGVRLARPKGLTMAYQQLQPTILQTHCSPSADMYWWLVPFASSLFNYHLPFGNRSINVSCIPLEMHNWEAGFQQPPLSWVLWISWGMDADAGSAAAVTLVVPVQEGRAWHLNAHCSYS